MSEEFEVIGITTIGRRLTGGLFENDSLEVLVNIEIKDALDVEISFKENKMFCSENVTRLIVSKSSLQELFSHDALRMFQSFCDNGTCAYKLKQIGTICPAGGE